MTQKEWLGLACASLMLLFPFAVMHFDPHVAHSQSLCPFKMLTGFPCPGCGITKSIIFLYQGELMQSLGSHAFGWMTLLASCAYILLILAKLTFKVEVAFTIPNRIHLAYALAFLLGGYHFIRLIYFVADHNFAQILKESVWA